MSRSKQANANNMHVLLVMSEEDKEKRKSSPLVLKDGTKRGEGVEKEHEPIKHEKNFIKVGGYVLR